MRRLLLLFFLYVFFSSCGDGTPKGIIPQKTMISLLTDLHLADGYTSSLYGDSANIGLATVYKAIYKKYDTDSVGLRRSLSYYAERPEKLELMYKEVENNLLTLQKQEQKRDLRERNIALRKMRLEQAIQREKERVRQDRLNISKGKYDFRLPSYRSPADDYLKIWKKYPVADTVKTDKTKTDKTDTVKVDSLRKDLSLKKEQKKNGLPGKRIR